MADFAAVAGFNSRLLAANDSLVHIERKNYFKLTMHSTVVPKRIPAWD